MIAFGSASSSVPSPSISYRPGSGLLEFDSTTTESVTDPPLPSATVTSKVSVVLLDTERAVNVGRAVPACDSEIALSYISILMNYPDFFLQVRADTYILFRDNNTEVRYPRSL